MTDSPEVEPTPEDSLALQRKDHTIWWVIAGVVSVAILAVGGTMLMGKDIVYYKTASEVAAMPSGQQVRLAGTLVKGSIVAQANTGQTDFKVTDGKTVIEVVYTGSASTALSTASKPGTQIVAEGKLDPDHVFRSESLIAKCPSKYSTKYVAKTSGNN